MTSALWRILAFGWKAIRNSTFLLRAKLQCELRGESTAILSYSNRALMHRLLLDKARSGDFFPNINTEQDVIETVFAPSLQPTETRLLIHRHGPQPECSERPLVGRSSESGANKTRSNRLPR